jgi:DNA repair protein RecN (Recombination protein N)
MLTELTVADLGVIAELSLVLGPGLTAITGETGAGKTLVVEAIELLVGGRADGVVVRRGAAEARVHGRFVAGDEEVVLTRVVPAGGRSRAYVDGRPAPVSELAARGAALVDLHGQHAHQSLLDRRAQRGLLDRFGGVDLEPLARATRRLTEIEAALASLGGDARARAREIDVLRFQVAEITGAAITDPDEERALEAEEDALADAAAHREAARAAHAALAGEGGAADAARAALAAVAGRAPFAELEARLRAVVAEIDEAARDVRRVGEHIDDDPARLAAVRARRQLLRELRRKYGATLAEVCAFGQEAAARLAELESHDERALALEAARDEARAAVAVAAREVAAARRSAAPRLAAAVEARLRELAMPHARVAVSVDGDDPADDVTFLLGANPGEPLLPLARVASGGELARAMLAVRLVLTTGPETLVFDEVDAGIGGRAAVAVGRALAALARHHQVLVVTHLPQVAAFADTHVVVEKATRGGRTTATASVVEGAERVAELSRMLSGLPASARAREHAAELLAAAAAAKDGGR